MSNPIAEFAGAVLKMRRELNQLKRNILRNVVIPEDGKFILPHHATDPIAEDGKMYYNTASDKARVCENGVWRDI